MSYLGCLPILFGFGNNFFGMRTALVPFLEFFPGIGRDGERGSVGEKPGSVLRCGGVVELVYVER
jgi:hypothetical protein